MRPPSWARRARARARCSTFSAALEPPTSGDVTLDGRDPFQLPEKELAAFRNQSIGFIFQDHCLLPQCSVLENVLVPTLVATDRRRLSPDRARELLDAGRAGRPAGSSARRAFRRREAARGAGARADPQAAAAAVRRAYRQPRPGLRGRGGALLLELHQRQETILIVVTHSAELAARFPVRYELRHANLHPAGA